MERAQHGLYPLLMTLTVDALVALNRQCMASSQSQTTPPSKVQRQPLTEVAFPTNTQDDNGRDIDESEVINPFAHMLSPTQVDKTMAKDLELYRQLKETLK